MIKVNFNVNNVKLGIVNLKNLKEKKSNKSIEDFEKDIFKEIKSKYSLDTIGENEIIKSFRELYWSFSMDPTKNRISSEALLRRILKGNNMWRINNIVDSLNMISAKSLLPMGYIDHSTFKGEITIRTTNKDEEFIKIGGKIKKCKGTEICVSDDEKIMDYGYATSDSDLTKVSDKTKDLMILIYGTKDVSDEHLKKSMSDSIEILSNFYDFKIEEESIKSAKVVKIAPKKEVKNTKKEEKKDTLGMTAKKDENFSEWYTQVIQKSKMADYSSVSGCIVYRPYSYEVWEEIQDFFNKKIKKSGVKNAYFPVLIPESLLNKEAAHVEGFAPEVAWVTHGGNTKLGERLAVRPTSETIMYDSYSKWIRSHNDLPLRLNQWNSVVRWEFKHATPFLRGREFLWQEGHTVFETKNEAEDEVFEISEYYSKIYEELLAVPVIQGKKTESEKFAGAEYSVSCETFLPLGKAVQGCTSHLLGQNFAKAFDISFLDKNGKKQYPWQNSWGYSTRSLGIMIITHGDDKGLVMPPKVAPIQVVIVPILFDKTKKKVLKEANNIKKKLDDFKIKLDDRTDYTPGWKYNEWELKGVPIRIEFGPRDLENNQAMLVRRDTGDKKAVKLNDIEKEVKKMLDKIQKNLYETAQKRIENSIEKVKNWDEFKTATSQKKWIKAMHCGDAKCEKKIKDETNGVKTNCIPFDQPKKLGKCVKCGKDGKYEILFAKSY
ncbi:proline--tRNA ligase [archaeon]|nr:proline--tRNA ligase [archaeon]